MTSAKNNFWLAAASFAATILASLLGTVILDVLTARRPDGGSITTHFPGYVYANVAVMKVSIVGSFALAAAGSLYWAVGRGSEDRPISLLSAAGLLILPTALLVSAVVVVSGTIIGPHASAVDSSRVSRIGVFVLLGLISAGVLISVAAVIKRERPFFVPLIGAASNLSLLILFYYFEFYKLGFDQDNWAN